MNFLPSILARLSLLGLWFGLTSCLSTSGTHPLQSQGGVVSGTTSYMSGGKKIKVETFFPEGAGRHPAVLVLYGSGGALVGKDDMTDFARLLAQHGFSAYVIHYFNRTNTVAAVDSTIFKHWKEWEAAVRDGVDFVAAHPRAQPERIGMFGYSLGAYMSLAVGSYDTRVKAVAELAGGIFDERRGKAVRFPPTLVLHGRQDERVPVTRVPQILSDARKVGVKPEVKYYDNEGHSLSPAALVDANSRALKFLMQHLQ